MTTYTYLRLLATTFTVVLWSNLPAYTSSSGVLPFVPIEWLVGLLGLSIPLMFQTRNAQHIHVNMVIPWSFVLILVTALWSFISDDFSSAITDLRQTLNFVVVLCYSLLLYSDAKARLVSLRAVAILTVGGVCINFYEFFNPGSFSAVAGRSAGLFINPNLSGSSLVMGLILTHSVVPVRWRTVYQLLVGTGVLLTLSRGSMIAWAVVVILQQLTSARTRGQARGLALAALLLIISLYSPIWTRILEQASTLSTQNQYLEDRLRFWESNRTLEDQRITILQEAWGLFLDRPLLGYGSGSALLDVNADILLGTHNQYLTMVIQFGIPGFLVLFSLFWIILRSAKPSHRRLAVIFVVFMMIEALFTHTMLKQWLYAVAIAMVAAESASNVGVVRQPASSEHPHDPSRIGSLSHNLSVE